VPVLDVAAAWLANTTEAARRNFMIWSDLDKTHVSNERSAKPKKRVSDQDDSL